MEGVESSLITDYTLRVSQKSNKIRPTYLFLYSHFVGQR